MNKENRFKIKVVKEDDMDAFGAYLSPSIKNGVGIVLLNVEAILDTSIEHDITPKEMFIEILMHEVGHALEEWYDLEFSEERMERIIESYINKQFAEADKEKP